MKKELDEDYDISVDNMLPMSENDLTGEWKIESSEFISRKTDKSVNINILKLENENTIKQIFKMNDGTFILEIEEDMEVSYFSSDEIKYLL